MTSQLLNRRQARWGMFLSKFDFKLDWAPGKDNVADAASQRPDFVPQTGDEHLTAQRQTLLTPEHIERLNSQNNNLPFEIPPHSFNAITTLSIDNTKLLKHFKAAYKEDATWKEAVVAGNKDFMASHDLVFHNSRLYIPPTLRRNVLFSRHDSIIGGHLLRYLHSNDNNSTTTMT
uniref:Reverse transcriptase-rnase h-integrase n=1 Tax=Moniliophthora roreri TaxID=221103 RepID=A0A0W0FXD7_MONRR